MPHTLYLDKVDYVLLRLLQDKGRSSLKELSKILEVSIPTVRSRILRLQERGVIKRFTAFLDLQIVTNQVTAYITLKTKLPNLKSVVESLKTIDEVSEAYVTTGQTDIVLKVHAPNMSIIDRLVTQKLSNLEGIETVYSNFVMETIKDSVGPILRPNFGFRIKCDNCRQIVGKGYAIRANNVFCGDACLSDFTRKS
jgi:DNA-binding Lrp family transcriptional regulator